jgi:acyl-CoA hydrolase
MTTNGRRVRDSQLSVSQIMGPNDANVYGNVHGGVIMRLVDEVGGIVATRHCHKPVVTVVIDSMTFISPVHIGDLLRLDGSVNWVGHTSIEVGVKVQAENVMSGALNHTNSAYCVYVALDETGRPVAVPPLVLESDEEKRRWEEGATRQQIRLARKSVRT